MTRRASVAEQRREDRVAVNGKARFVLVGGSRREMEGHLVDASKSGFRVSHSHAELSAGQRVRFRHSQGEGVAVVMWTRIMASHVETGFLIVP